MEIHTAITKESLDSRMQLLGFEKTEIYTGNSFFIGCHFYKTKQYNVWLTDYHVSNHNDLKESRLLMLFFKIGKFMRYQLISGDLIIDSSKRLVDSLIEQFYEESKGKIA